MRSIRSAETCWQPGSDGRDGVAAGRTIAAAMEEVEQAAADMPDRAAGVDTCI